MWWYRANRPTTDRSIPNETRRYPTAVHLYHTNSNTNRHNFSVQSSQDAAFPEYQVSAKSLVFLLYYATNAV